MSGMLYALTRKERASKRKLVESFVLRWDSGDRDGRAAGAVLLFLGGEEGISRMGDSRMEDRRIGDGEGVRSVPIWCCDVGDGIQSRGMIDRREVLRG